MKTMIAIVFIFFWPLTMAFSSQRPHSGYSALVIQYFGEVDKPVTPIVISDSKSGAEWCRTNILKQNKFELTSVHVVSGHVMVQLMNKASSYRNSESAASTKSQPSNGTLITPLKAGNETSFSLSLKSADLLIEDLKKLCSEDKPLYDDLSHFQVRIEAL